MLAGLLLSVLSTTQICFAQFKNRYSNLPPVTGFGGQQQQPQQQYLRTTPTRMIGGGGQRTAAIPQGPVGVYPQFRASVGVVRWVADQMPLRVWVSNGVAIDAILDPALGAPYTNVESVPKWPTFLASVLQNPDQLKTLPTTQGYIPQHRQAAIEGINYWKRFEKEGLFSFEYTDDPTEADIHVFFVNHFVNRLGLGLFANDIRGYTSKDVFPYKLILQGKQAAFKPVVVILRCTEKDGVSMPPVKMRAAAGHEFGHVLGIDGHSVNPHDLMSIYYGNGVLSASDAATIKHLYKLAPDSIP